MSVVTGGTWRAEYGEISEREQFRVGYVRQETWEAYFPIVQLADLVAVLNGVVPLGLDVLSLGGQVQARKVSTGFRTEVVIEPRSDTFPVQIMRFENGSLTDLISVLSGLQAALSNPSDWDDSKPTPIPESLLPERLSEAQLDARFSAPRVSGIERDWLGRVTAYTEGSVDYTEISRDAAGLVTSFKYNGITRVITRDGGLVTGVS